MNVGDKVVLKSGGPAMAVEFVYDDAYVGPIVYLVWFSGEELQTARLPEACVRLVEATENDV